MRHPWWPLAASVVLVASLASAQPVKQIPPPGNEIDAKDRATTDAFVRSDPYHVNKVWETVQIHGYNKKRGTPIASRR